MPLILTLAIFRFSRASRSSRARIKQLEQDARTAGQEKLVDILAELELEVEEVEEAVVDLIDNPMPSSSYPSSKKESSSRVQPIVTPNHTKIVNWLNLIPIKKKLAYFPGVRNSHAVIVCRDVEGFEYHRQGEGILRHWANSFIL